MSTFVFVYDDGQGWLSGSFWFGAALRGLRPGLDEFLPVRSAQEAIDGIRQISARSGPIARVESWGHGASGAFRYGSDRVVSDATARAAKPGSGIVSVADFMHEIAPSLTEDAVFWARTCASFWREQGRDLAWDGAGALGGRRRFAGFRYKIHVLQGGLSVAEAGVEPGWGDDGGTWTTPFTPDLVWCMSRARSVLG